MVMKNLCSIFLDLKLNFFITFLFQGRTFNAHLNTLKFWNYSLPFLIWTSKIHRVVLKFNEEWTILLLIEPYILGALIWNFSVNLYIFGGWFLWEKGWFLFRRRKIVDDFRAFLSSKFKKFRISLRRHHKNIEFQS